MQFPIDVVLPEALAALTAVPNLVLVAPPGAGPDAANYPDGYPDGVQEALIDNDFSWMAANRERILAEWSSRYEAKAAPRN